MDVKRLYQAFKLLGTQRIQHASSFSVAPAVANYAKYKPLKQKTNWSNGRVTYQGAISQNSFGNGVPSKEIENFTFWVKNTGERWLEFFAGGRKECGTKG